MDDEILRPTEAYKLIQQALENLVVFYMRFYPDSGRMRLKDIKELAHRYVDLSMEALEKEYEKELAKKVVEVDFKAIKQSFKNP